MPAPQTSTLPHQEEGYEPPTPEQRGLYWVWMQEVADQLETSKDLAHKAFKGIFLKGNSSMDLHRVQYTDYMEKVRGWCEENGLDLSESPNKPE